MIISKTRNEHTLKTIAACLILLFSATLHAQAPSSTITEAKKAEIATLANQICDTMMLYKTFGKLTYVAFEKMILKYLQQAPKEPDGTINGISNDVSAFWQQFHQYFICTTPHHGYPTPQHLLKRVVDMNTTASFYFEYLLHDEAINLNAIEWVDGEPKTLVDYLDEILADQKNNQLYDLETVRRLRDFAIYTYDGKRACELRDGYHCPAH